MNRKLIWERLVLDFRGGALRYRIIHRTKRIAQAFRLATGRLTVEDAQDLYLPITQLSGWRPIVTVDNEGVLNDLRERYVIDDRVLEYVDMACERVASKWPGADETYGSARDWAVDLVHEYAREEGAELVEIGAGELDGEFDAEVVEA